jgi:predicted phage tail component-like protein
MLENEFGFTFATMHSSNFNIKIIDIRRNIFPELSDSMLSIPGRYGSYYTGTSVNHRVIQIDFDIIASSHDERLSLSRLIAYWLFSTNADQEIIFDDEPDKIYYGHVANSIEVQRSLFNGKATLEIHCSDPFAYSTDEKTITPDENGKFTFINEGTATTFPVFNTTFNNDATFLSLTSPDGIVLIGSPPDAQANTTPKETVVLQDYMKTTANWSNAGNVLDAGRINTGSVYAQADAVWASDYGEGTEGAKIWHGPAIRQNLPQTVKDFTASVRLFFRSTTNNNINQMGQLEIYLFDQNGAKIGKMCMRDSYTNYEYNVPEIFIGNESFLKQEPAPPKPTTIAQKQYTTYIVKKGDTLWDIGRKFKVSMYDIARINNISINSTLQIGQKLKIYDKTVTKTVYPTSVGDYNDFYGIFIISRIGNKWYAEVSRLDSNARKYKTISRTFYDTGGKYPTSDLAYVVIHFAQFDTNPVVPEMGVTDVRIVKTNSPSPDDNVTIFHAGDELEIDFTDSSVWLNGDLFMNELDVASTFFPIDVGTTEVIVNTDDTTATHSATFTERYL